jgi:hypothetical protein
MNIDNFRKVFKGGTRQNRFRIDGDLFVAGTERKFSQLTADGQLLAKATQVPPSTIGIIPVPFRGRIAKVPGDRQYLEWPIVIYDTDSDIYRLFQAWSESLNQHSSNTRTSGFGDTKETGLTTWSVDHLDLNGDRVLKKVTLHNCWPVEVGSIDLSYDALDTVVEFPVTIAYDYFTTDSEFGTAGGQSEQSNVN